MKRVTAGVYRSQLFAAISHAALQGTEYASGAATLMKDRRVKPSRQRFCSILVKLVSFRILNVSQFCKLFAKVTTGRFQRCVGYAHQWHHLAHCLVQITGSLIQGTDYLVQGALDLVAQLVRLTRITCNNDELAHLCDGGV